MQRNTRQRTAICAALDAAGRPLSPAEVLAVAREQVPGLGQATVYRALKSLAEEQVIDTVALPGEAPRYETRRPQHHHHFKCTRCLRVFDVSGCPGGLAALTPPGFALEGHELVLYGRCDACTAAAA